ncbi:MAG: dihydropteroate synthase [Polyangiales bacterium]
MRCEVWGVLNVTPDSFSDGGQHFAREHAIAHALRMHRSGAAVIDVGGESTRPQGAAYGAGFTDVDIDEEIRRVIPVVEALCAQGIRVSIDTTKPAVAAAAIGVGASVVNDVSGARCEDC